MQIILASNSPRRCALLTSLGLEFTVAGGRQLDEKQLLRTLPGSLEQKLEQLAIMKGKDAAAGNSDALVISADTEVVLDGECLGKPSDAEHAEEMLAKLSGRMHHVVTAVAVQRGSDGLVLSGHAKTAVEFNKLDGEQITRYVEMDNPLDKAGAYGIQGLGALLVRRIEGDYPNVVGLPLGLVASMLRQAGIRIL